MLERFQVFAEGLDHPEGVAVGPDGQLYAGGEAGQVYRVTFDGDVEEIANSGGFLLGIAVDADDNLYCCDLGRAEVVRVDSEAGVVDVYSDGTADTPMRTPNYPAFDVEGNLYVTDSGEFGADDGLIFRVSPGGKTTVWTRAVTNFPNGCCLSRDGNALIVVVSTPDPGIVRIPIEADGSAGPPERVIHLEGTVPDGVAVAENGDIYLGCYRPDRIYRVTEEGEAEIVGDDPQGTVLAAPTNLAFAGERLDRLVVASLGRWHLTVGDLGVTGQPLHYPSLDTD
jgi:gluconolactonase